MRKPLMVTAGLVLSLLAAGVWISGCNEEKVGAEDLLAETGRNFMAADSYHTRLDATMEISGDATGYDPDLNAALPLSLGFGGQMDLDTSNRDSIKLRVYDISVDGLTDMIRKVGEASGNSDMSDIMAAGMISQMFSGMEVIFIKDTIYLQMSGAWFDFKLSDLPASEDADFSKADLNCLISSLLESEDTWDSQGGLTDIGELDEEEIDGVKTRHITASLDPETVMNQPDQTSEIDEKCGFGDLADSVRNEAYDENAGAGEAAEKAFTESLARNTHIDFWIDSDNNLRQERIDMELNFGDISRLAGDDKEAEQMKSMVMKLSMTMKFSGYDEAADIIAPEDTTPMKSFFDEMGGSGMGMGGSRSEQA